MSEQDNRKELLQGKELTADRARSIGPKGKVWSEKIEELHDRIFEICKENNIPYFSVFGLDIIKEGPALSITSAAHGAKEGDEASEQCAMLFHALKAITERDAIPCPAEFANILLPLMAAKAAGANVDAQVIPVGSGQGLDGLKDMLEKIKADMEGSSGGCGDECQCVDCVTKRSQQAIYEGMNKKLEA